MNARKGGQSTRQSRKNYSGECLKAHIASIVNVVKTGEDHGHRPQVQAQGAPIHLLLQSRRHDMSRQEARERWVNEQLEHLTARTIGTSRYIC